MRNDIKILIATDGSDEALQAGVHVVELFGEEGVSYSVVSVGEALAPPITPLGITPALYTVALSSEDSVLPIDLAVERANQMVEALDVDTTATAIADAGGAGPTICDLAAEIDADVLVVGAHETSWWERFIEGSTTDYLTRNAPCDVLVVRSLDDERAEMTEVDDTTS